MKFLAQATRWMMSQESNLKIQLHEKSERERELYSKCDENDGS